MPAYGGYDAPALGVTPLGCEGALGTWRPFKVTGHGRAGEQGGDVGRKPCGDGVYVGQHLSFTRHGKATDSRPRSEPDPGKPAVRDRRGACGNMMHGLMAICHDAGNGGYLGSH